MLNYLSANSKDLNGFPQAIPEVYAWTLTRSPSSNLLFNVVGVNNKGVHLCVQRTDLPFEEAAEIVEQLNC